MLRICGKNRGRDLSTLMLGWKDMIEDNRVIIHCHTKKTPHANMEFGSAWRRSLLEATFPVSAEEEIFEALMANGKTGMIMPWPHSFVAKNVNWGKNYNQSKGIMDHLGMKISRDTLLYFPAGSFFWTKSNLLKTFEMLQLRWQDFKHEPLGPDGTLAHALERCLGLVASMSGLENYVYWGGREKHGFETGRIHPAIIRLPRFDEAREYTKTWFSMGLSQAFKSDVAGSESIALDRSVPRHTQSAGDFNGYSSEQGVSFLICGAQKAGTTALADYLRRHPQVFIPDRKELHFFDDENKDWSNPDYTGYHAEYSSASPSQILGEATPIYMYWEHAAERIWRYNADMKIIVILRNPIERAYSHWAMECHRGTEVLGFQEALKIEERRERSALPFQDRWHSYIDRGYYSEQIRRLWRWFGAEAVLALRHEELRDDHSVCLARVCEHLKIEEFVDIRPLRSNQGRYEGKMSGAMYNQLISSFEGEIMTLEQMLGWDLSDWLKERD